MPTLVLLHGHSGNHRDWTDLTDIERAGRLLAEMIARFDDAFLPDLRQELMRPDKRQEESQ